MDDQNRLDLILAQARIAKAAMTTELSAPQEHLARSINQAQLALEAIVLLADPDFHNNSTAT